MLSVVRLVPPAPGADLREPGEVALELLSRRPGFVRGTLGRATDDVDSWVLVTEWTSVGAYRRGLGHREVKLGATAFLGLAVDAPSAFEALVTATPGEIRTGGSDVEDDPLTGSLAQRLAGVADRRDQDR